MSFKGSLSKGKMRYGAWIGLGNTEVSQIMGRAGFDFLCVDLQHSFVTMDQLPAILDSIAHTETPAIVRVPWNRPEQIMRALDFGAQAIIVPMINNAREAIEAANACRYAPRGNRSWGPIWRNVRSQFPEAPEADEMNICLCMIETAEAYANLDQILAVQEMDGIYIGPNDLSLSIGEKRKNYQQSQRLHDVIVDVISRAKNAGKLVGIDCSGPQQAQYWKSYGVDFVINANDNDILTDAAKKMALSNHDS